MAKSDARTVARGLRWSKIFKFQLNDASDRESRMCNGSIEFQTAGVITLKARLPIDVF